MQLDTRQFKILQEMGFPMSGFALRKMKMAKPNEFYSAPDEQSAQNQIFSAHSGNEAVAPPTSQTALAPQRIEIPAHPTAPTTALFAATATTSINSSTQTISINSGSKKSTEVNTNNQFAITNASLIRTYDWTQLKTEVTACQSCALSKTRQRVVWGSLIEVAASKSISPKPLEQLDRLDWLIIDINPTDIEDQTANPLAHESGQLLLNMLKAIRHQDPLATGSQVSTAPARNFGLINAVKCHTPGSRRPDEFETNQCKPYLQRQIELLKPKSILLLGLPTYQAIFEEPLKSGTQKTPSLTQLRTQVLHLLGIPTFVTYHPSSLLLHPQDKAKVWQDLSRAQAYLLSHEHANN